MENQAKSAKGISWTVIVLLFIFCFPGAFVAMIHKLHQEKENYIANAKGTAKAGWFVVGIGVLYLILGFYGQWEFAARGASWTIAPFIFLFVVVSGCGGKLISHANKYKRLGEEQLRYLAIVSSQPAGFLDDIAAAYPKGYTEVCNDLQRMMNDGFFPGYYLNFDDGIFVGPHKKTRAKVRKTKKKKVQLVKNMKKVVKCPGCNGINIVLGDAGECEYCGSTLE